ncbi:MAG TPA: hypothetical protein VF520_13395 [Thermoleophilaceae bacterium]
MADESAFDPAATDAAQPSADAARATGDPVFGITSDGFVPKPFVRLLDEKLALARELFGDDADLGSGSAIRKLLELSALEDTRTWAALGTMYDNSFVGTACGEALTRLGEELGLSRPFLQARGRVTLRLEGKLPDGRDALVVPRGARMLTEGGDHAAIESAVRLSVAEPAQEVDVAAFHPGPEHNLDPAKPEEKLGRWNVADAALEDLVDARAAARGELDVVIEHDRPLAGGELQWPDVRYRALLLRAPRSIWTVDAIRVASSLVPGVRQVQVHDAWGSLDIHQSIFGTLDVNFIQRLFGGDQGSTSAYQVSILVAPTPAAIWSGADGLEQSVLAAIEDVRPIGIVPTVQEAEQIGIGVAADVDAQGLPLPSGTGEAINRSQPAIALKTRLMNRARRYVDGLDFGEPVRVAEIVAAMLEEPGVVDVSRVRLLKYPPDGVAAADGPGEVAGNVKLEANQIAVFVEAVDRLSL